MTPQKRKTNIYMLMAFTGNAIFGFSFLFSKLALDTAEPLVLLAVRFTAAFILMNLLCVFHIAKIDLRGKNLVPLLILGLLQPVLYFIFETYGLKYTTSSFTGIMIALIPIAGLFFGMVLLREKPTALQIFFSVLSVSGVIFMTAMDDLGTFNLKGFIILIGAIISAALFSIQSRAIADKYTAFERTYVMFGLGTVVFILMAMVQSRGNAALWLTPLSSLRFWISILYLSGFSSVGAFMLLNKSLDGLDVTRSLVFANVSTVISVFAGILILHESFSAKQAAGIIMVLSGVYGVNRFTAKKTENAK